MDALLQKYGLTAQKLLRNVPTWMRMDPNNITMMRIVFVPVFLFLPTGLTQWGALLAATITFVATDMLDGACARAWDMVTIEGKHFDPLADKIVLLNFLLYLLAVGIIPMGLFVLIFLAEIAVVAIALYWIHDSWIHLAQPRSLRSLLTHLDNRTSVHAAGKIKIAMYCIALVMASISGMTNNAILAVLSLGFALLGVLFAAFSIPRYLNPQLQPPRT